MGKGAGSVSIIGGADGPTSIFIAGKGGKVKFTTRIRNLMQIGVETVWQVLDGSYSGGDKKTMKQLRKLFKKIYLYYGVNAKDIKKETGRYNSHLTILCS